jgi:hypothetical protein
MVPILRLGVLEMLDLADVYVSFADLCCVRSLLPDSRKCSPDHHRGCTEVVIRGQPIQVVSTPRPLLVQYRNSLDTFLLVQLESWPTTDVVQRSSVQQE